MNLYSRLHVISKCLQLAGYGYLVSKNLNRLNNCSLVESGISLGVNINLVKDS